MTPDRAPEAESPGRKPIQLLIQIGQDELPAHFKKNRVEGGIVVEDTEQGRVEISVVALPPEDKRSTLGKFWNRVKAALGSQQPETAKLPPTPVATRPIYSDEYRPGEHVQLMAHMPYVVLEDGTRYGIAVSVPAGLLGQWENFEEPVTDGNLIGFSNQIKIGQRRKGLAVVIRTDDGQPLMRKDLSTTTLQLFQEMLSEGFQLVESDPSRAQCLVDQRTTVKKGPSLEVGEKRKDQSTQEALLFSALGANEGVGTVDDKKGRIEVVVYQVIEEQVSEIIDRPLPSVFAIRDSVRDLFGSDRGGGTKSGGILSGGYSAGKTDFGKETRRKVDIQGVKVERPLAAFQLVLVGEIPGRAMEMVTS